MPDESFPFEDVPGIEPSCVHPDPEFGVDGIREFMTRNPEESFCLVTGLIEPHAPWTVGDHTHFDLEELKLPPYMADTPETREDYAKYLAEIEVLDQEIGEILQVFIHCVFLCFISLSGMLVRYRSIYKPILSVGINVWPISLAASCTLDEKVITLQSKLKSSLCLTTLPRWVNCFASSPVPLLSTRCLLQSSISR